MTLFVTDDGDVWCCETCYALATDRDADADADRIRHEGEA